MIDILLEDPWFLVINKPIDLLSQAPSGIPNVQHRLIEQLSPHMAKTPFVGLPHRLDRMTSGVMVVARNQRSLRRLCDQFAARTVGKEYLAWVHGRLPKFGHWLDHVRKVPDEPRAEIVTADRPDAKQAELSFETMRESLAADGELLSLVRIRLSTGRMHQIRIQFGSRGHPILGDRLYGSSLSEIPQEPERREPAVALHAIQLAFSHPKNGARIVVDAPTPSEFPWTICQPSELPSPKTAP
jgi:RluA family pseudouridine synthase